MRCSTRASSAARGLGVLAVLTVLALLALLATRAPPARAQSDAAIAEALFQQGRALMDKGDYAAACKKLAASLSHDRATGTLWHLAGCLEKTGAIASAWARYRELEAEARKTGEPRKASAANKRAAALEPRLPRLTLEVAEDVRVDGLVVTLGDADIASGAWGTPLPVDPGTHAVTARAPGHRTWRGEVVIEGAGARVQLAVPELEVLPAAPVGDVGVVAPGVPDPIGPTRDVGPPWHRDTLGWALAGTGVALALGGGIAFAKAGSLESDADNAADLDARDGLLDDADGYRNAGTGLLVVGTGLAIAGAVRLILTPDADDRAPRAGITLEASGFAVTLGGRF